MVVRDEVVDFVINEFGDYNPTFADVLKELCVEESELTSEQTEMIKNKVGD